jgi:hypothetical protein
MKLEIWPGGPSALTQQKLSQPIRVTVFTSHREGEDNLVDTSESGNAYTRRSSY